MHRSIDRFGWQPGIRGGCTNVRFAPTLVIQPPWPSPPKRTLLGDRRMAGMGGNRISVTQASPAGTHEGGFTNQEFHNTTWSFSTHFIRENYEPELRTGHFAREGP